MKSRVSLGLGICFALFFSSASFAKWDDGGSCGGSFSGSATSCAGESCYCYVGEESGGNDAHSWFDDKSKEECEESIHCSWKEKLVGETCQAAEEDILNERSDIPFCPNGCTDVGFTFGEKTMNEDNTCCTVQATRDCRPSDKRKKNGFLELLNSDVRSSNQF